MAMMTHGTDASVVFDVLYAVGDERLVICVDEDLPQRELATEVITNVIALREDLVEVVDDLRDMADELGWSMDVARLGARTELAIS